MDASSASQIMIQNGHKEAKRKQHESSSKGGWNSAMFIIAVEVAERFAFYGLSANLINYFTDKLGQSISTAAKNVNTWVGVSALFPLLGAFVADAYLGRFKTILLSSIIYFLGIVLLTLSVSVIPLHYRKAVFFTAIYVLAIGEGGHKPCVQTFAADQFDEDTPEQKKTKSSFFNWWYLGIVIGASVATTAVIYIQDNVGWGTAFGVLAGILGVALVVFLLGIRTYRKESPVGSPLTTVAQVLVASAKKWRVSETRNHGICSEDDEIDGVYLEDQPKPRKLARTKQFRFLDKAAIIDNIDVSSKKRNPWRLCTLNQVEEVKLVLRLIPIWLACLMFATIQAQLHTFFTKQGGTLKRSIGHHFLVPPASLMSLVGVTILIFVPIYDGIVVPMARKITGHTSGITMLQRIGIGLFLTIVEMVVAALIESKRVKIARDHGLLDSPKAVIPMSIWWLLPQYILTGIVDVFTYVGLQELSYDQMPDTMRSLGAAAQMLVVGIGSFVSTAVIDIVQAIGSRAGGSMLGDNLNRAHLDYFYWVLAGLSAVNLCVYVLIARGFVYKKVEEGGLEFGLKMQRDLSLHGYSEAEK
ncbi:hypothetical protein HS088_TW21G01484 [Tripterygium wilfordii]|uniref:Protein NRT1/ PTR FAMILY 5.4-like n=1 Tax=Tripterygium wilfordii TaxID=458696 RepID=A0A7J7C584_TRIWF|nr:protein NRT1/ PTR FAMILY 5.4 [Tripterygium wilfordii]KAF5729320.1 hypothetical protein HS088_TW21G01484 [Tripterygium wilfordii]